MYPHRKELVSRVKVVMLTGLCLFSRGGVAQLIQGIATNTPQSSKHGVPVYQKTMKMVSSETGALPTLISSSLSPTETASTIKMDVWELSYRTPSTVVSQIPNPPTSTQVMRFTGTPDVHIVYVPKPPDFTTSLTSLTEQITTTQVCKRDISVSTTTSTATRVLEVTQIISLDAPAPPEPTEPTELNAVMTDAHGNKVFPAAHMTSLCGGGGGAAAGGPRDMCLQAWGGAEDRMLRWCGWFTASTTTRTHTDLVSLVMERPRPDVVSGAAVMPNAALAHDLCEAAQTRAPPVAAGAAAAASWRAGGGRRPAYVYLSSACSCLDWFVHATPDGSRDGTQTQASSAGDTEARATGRGEGAFASRRSVRMACGGEFCRRSGDATQGEEGEAAVAVMAERRERRRRAGRPGSTVATVTAAAAFSTPIPVAAAPPLLPAAPSETQT